ncbi:hypothetical protein GCM10007859_18350 [Brevundimonas denitrificans]|uniref:BLUF domain-containing protein n=1 Tax=Brevundimonas denitrificans TaxID=1443434 RepID=A0ABQ6BK50_9CAUL|nr:BLUF domain-containing protein [Brevundimonas denitrificans]GLS01819.1 hypothetical protein GCM10007859_18350 [Brevundimonas denitrificans]
MGLRLERLVYESTATGTTGSITNLAVILAESQRNNDRDELTGALAAHDDRYIQVIEGSAPALDNLLRRLEGDPRHRNIVILERAPITARAFGRWAMASARITPELAPVLDAVMSTPAAQLVEALQQALDQGARAAV